MRRITDASAKSLGAAVKEMVAPGSAMRTDDWLGYNGLEAQGYLHEVVRKQSTVGDNLLPLANRVASLLKRWLLGTHQGAVRSSHLDYYFDEFTFRFNRRTSRSRGMLFYRLVQQAMVLDPVPGKLIVGGQPRNLRISRIGCLSLRFLRKARRLGPLLRLPIKINYVNFGAFAPAKQHSMAKL